MMYKKKSMFIRLKGLFLSKITELQKNSDFFTFFKILKELYTYFKNMIINHILV